MPPLITRPSTISKLSSSARCSRTSWRYHPFGGGGNRMRRRPSKAPRRPRIRPMVRSEGTRSSFSFVRRLASSRRIAAAPNSPRSLMSRSSFRSSTTRASISGDVAWASRRPPRVPDQSTRSNRRSAACATQRCTVCRVTPNRFATDLIEAPLRTATTIFRRRSSIEFLTHRSVSHVRVFLTHGDPF